MSAFFSCSVSFFVHSWFVRLQVLFCDIEEFVLEILSEYTSQRESWNRLLNMECRTFCLKDQTAETHAPCFVRARRQPRGVPHPPAIIIFYRAYFIRFSSFVLIFTQLCHYCASVISLVILSTHVVTISASICRPIINSRTSVKMHAPAAEVAMTC